MLTMTRGDTCRRVIRAMDASGKFVPFVSGDVVRVTVRRSALDGEKLISKEIRDFIDGAALLVIDPADTSGLDFGDYVFDIELTLANGDVYTIVGPDVFRLGAEVTYD